MGDKTQIKSVAVTLFFKPVQLDETKTVKSVAGCLVSTGLLANFVSSFCG